MLCCLWSTFFRVVFLTLCMWNRFFFKVGHSTGVFGSLPDSGGGWIHVLTHGAKLSATGLCLQPCKCLFFLNLLLHAPAFYVLLLWWTDVIFIDGSGILCLIEIQHRPYFSTIHMKKLKDKVNLNILISSICKYFSMPVYKAIEVFYSLYVRVLTLGICFVP